MVGLANSYKGEYSLTECSVTAIASGAVACAENKRNGPKRYIQCSYGFLRSEPYEPTAFRGHLHAARKKDKLDGDCYVKVINYFVTKVILTILRSFFTRAYVNAI
jgi:hypothetical protein